MRRVGYIIEEIVEPSNMEASFRQVLRGSKRKRSRQGGYLLAHKPEVLEELAAQIASGTFRVKDYREREIIEGGKLRRIQVIPMKDRIAVHAIMAVVDRHLRKRFIRTTSASIKRRGMHDLLAYVRRDMAEDPDGTRYCYKFDITKFYESVKQDFVMYCVSRVFKDAKLVTMLESFVRLMPEGLSIGLRSSQGLGNLLLSVYLDHYLKDRYAVRHFYRYCDDGVVLGKTKAELWKIRDAVHGRMECAGLLVKGNERVFPPGEGIDFLGYVTFGADHVRLRKRIKQKFARKMHEVKSRRRRRELIASFYGMAGVVVSIRELVNLPIIVKDFETGIKTEQGEDRCIVAIEMNGEPKKFFTNSEEMKNILLQVKEMPDGFPFETTIKTETFGKGRTKYIFT